MTEDNVSRHMELAHKIMDENKDVLENLAKSDYEPFESDLEYKERLNEAVNDAIVCLYMGTIDGKMLTDIAKEYNVSYDDIEDKLYD